jgi:hypothetical protein
MGLKQRPKISGHWLAGRKSYQACQQIILNAFADHPAHSIKQGCLSTLIFFAKGVATALNLEIHGALRCRAIIIELKTGS